MSDAPGCLICQQEKVDATLTVFSDPDWAAGVIEGFDVPGWIVLRIRRHAVQFDGLNATELASFGRRARDLIAAVREVTGSVCNYLMLFGEANPHFHVLITPRTPEIGPEHRLGAILQLREKQRNLEAAKALVPGIRTAYAERARAAT